ncbi:MAG: hypothetical protein ACOCWZ_10195 [Spirochaetota bacterium]
MRAHRLILLLIVLAFVWSCSSSGVKTQPHNVGDRGYDFTLPDQDGNMVTLSNVLKDHRGAVIAFYPKDDSKN